MGIRVEYSEKTRLLTAIEKVYDSEIGMLSSDSSMWKGSNPMCTSLDDHFISNTHVVHGKTAKWYDSGKLLSIQPYVYTVDENGSYYLDGLNQNREFNIRADKYKVFVYDKSKKQDKRIEEVLPSYIVDSENIQNGANVVIYSFWSDPRAIFIYE